MLPFSLWFKAYKLRLEGLIVIQEKVKDYICDSVDYGIIAIALKDIMKKRDMSIYSLSKKTGIKYDLLKKYYYNELYRIDLTNVAKICFVLNCCSCDLIKYIPPKKSRKWRDFFLKLYFLDIFFYFLIYIFYLVIFKNDDTMIIIANAMKKRE